jgi:hypothetical protein
MWQHTRNDVDRRDLHDMRPIRAHRWFPAIRIVLVLLIAVSSALLPALVLAQPAGPRPLVTELSVSGKRNPTDGTIKFAPLEIPVYAEGPAERSKIFQPGDLVGAVAGPGPSGFVYVAAYDASLASATVVTVPLEIRGLTAAGTYVGQVDVTNNVDEKDAVKLTVIISDATEEAVKPLVLVTELSVSGERDPDSGSIKFTPLEIPVYAAGSAERSKIFQPGDLVGAVAGPGPSGFAYVAAHDTSRASASVVTVPLEIRGLTAAGTYVGQVDVTNNVDEKDAVKLTVIISDATEETVKSLVTDLAVKGVHIPFEKQMIYDPIVIPVPAPGTGWVMTATEVLVGVVSGPGQMGNVYRVTCGEPVPVGNITDVTPICLQIRGLGAAGTYTGQADLRTLGDGADIVKLTVTINDHIIFAILASAIGVLIAAAALWLGGGLVPYLEMSGRARTLEEQIKALNGQNEPARHGYTIAFAEYFKSFWNDFNDYKWRLIWDKTSEDYKALVELLDEVEADIDRFENEFDPALAKLSAKKDVFLAFLSTDPLGLGASVSPPLAKVVAQHLVGTPLPIGKLQPRLDTWQALADLMQTWMDMVASIKRYTDWAEQLDPKLTQPKDKDSLIYVKTKLAEARHELYDVSVTQDLTTLRTQKELDDVYRILAQLGSRYAVWVPAVSPVILTKGMRVPDFSAFTDISLPIEAILEPEKAPPELLIGMRWVTDLVLALFALVVAVFTGLQANYFGKVFGAPQDYFAMLLLGGGAQAAITGIVAVVERLFKRG